MCGGATRADSRARQPASIGHVQHPVPQRREFAADAQLPLKVDPSQLSRIRELVSTNGWDITLWLKLAGDFEFPIFLLHS